MAIIRNTFAILALTAAAITTSAQSTPPASSGSLTDSPPGQVAPGKFADFLHFGPRIGDSAPLGEKAVVIIVSGPFSVDTAREIQEEAAAQGIKGDFTAHNRHLEVRSFKTGNFVYTMYSNSEDLLKQEALLVLQ